MCACLALRCGSSGRYPMIISPATGVLSAMQFFPVRCAGSLAGENKRRKKKQKEEEEGEKKERSVQTRRAGRQGRSVAMALGCCTAAAAACSLCSCQRVSSLPFVLAVAITWFIHIYIHLHFTCISFDDLTLSSPS